MSLANIVVNGRYLTRPPTGVDRFAIELLGALSRRRAAAAAPLRIAVPAGTALRDPQVGVDNEVVAVGRRHGHAWEQLELPGAANGRALINLCNTAPLWRERQMVVIHDLGTVVNAANYTWAFRSWYRLMIAGVMRRARVVASVSRFSAEQLAAHAGRRARGIEVIHEGGEHILAQPADEAILDRLALRGRRYVLAVGSASPNKNFAGVLQALRLLDDPELLLVAAGGGDPRIYAGGGDSRLDAGGDSRIDAGSAVTGPQLRRTGYISDGELRALYENAACFAFPSFHEGFGLPPLEAMCCGCPVVVSDRASLPEVCGEAALYCKAEDPATLAAALRRLLASPALRAELSERGRAHAGTFGWDKAARHFEQIVDAEFA